MTGFFSRPDPDQPRVNPLAQLAGSFFLGVPVFLGFDRVTPWLALATALPVLLVCLRPRLSVWLPVALPLVFVSGSAALANLLFAIPSSGQSASYAQWGIFAITRYSVGRALAIFSRTLVLTVITTLTAVSMSPLALIRALMQNLGLSPRWGFSLYAGLNIIPGLKDDLDTLKYTRRIRLAGRRERLRDALSLPAFLLAGAIRSAERISISMTVRGLEEAEHRTFLVSCPWRVRDNLYITLCAVLAGMTVIISVREGFFLYNLG